MDYIRFVMTTALRGKSKSESLLNNNSIASIHWTIIHPKKNYHQRRRYYNSIFLHEHSVLCPILRQIRVKVHNSVADNLQSVCHKNTLTTLRTQVDSEIKIYNENVHT